MILDSIFNYAQYTALHPLFAKAFAYLTTTDFNTVESGKYEIQGTELYALVQEYTPKPITEGRLEGHKKYIDIQYVVTGEENIGYANLLHQEISEAIPEKDISFYTGEFSILPVSHGTFAIFYPTDLHAPCLESNYKGIVKKVVVKVQAQMS